MTQSMTSLETFLTAHGLKPAAVARGAMISRAYLHRLRKGECRPSQRMMRDIAAACSELLKRTVTVEELFDQEAPNV